MKPIVVLGTGSGWHVEDLTRAARSLGLDLRTVRFSDVSATLGTATAKVQGGGLELTEAGGVLVRTMPPGSLEQVVFRMDALHRVAAAGVVVWNSPRAVEAAVDKYLTLSLLERVGLPIPPTWTGQTAVEALAAFDAMGGDVILKPLFGSEGRGLLRLSDRELAWRAFYALERLGAVLYLQRAVRSPGYDLRVLVLQGRVLGSIRRYPAPGEWRTNVSRGGRVEPCSLEPEEERLALAAAAAVGTEIAGIDLIEDLDRNGPRVLELNAVPGWRGFAGATGIDVATALLLGLREAMR
jgi:RimK family alpha-L-glutamate ligase